MLRKLIESQIGPLTNAQFAEITELATTDIKINRAGFGKRTSLSQAVEIAVICAAAAGRGKVA